MPAIGDFTKEEVAVIAFMEGEASTAPKSGSFTNALIDAIAKSDPVNRGLLSRGFPEMVKAVNAYQMGNLHERWESFRTGKPIPEYEPTADDPDEGAEFMPRVSQE